MSKLVVLSLAIAVVIVLSAVSYYIIQFGGLENKSADEYFEILSPTVDYGEPVENGTMWKVYEMSFTLKAVGGEAHTVIVYVEGMAEPTELGNFLKDESTWVPIEFPRPGYLIEMNEDGKFPIRIEIRCDEASGFITIPL